MKYFISSYGVMFIESLLLISISMVIFFMVISIFSCLDETERLKISSATKLNQVMWFIWTITVYIKLQCNVYKITLSDFDLNGWFLWLFWILEDYQLSATKTHVISFNPTALKSTLFCCIMLKSCTNFSCSFNLKRFIQWMVFWRELHSYLKRPTSHGL